MAANEAGITAVRRGRSNNMDWPNASSGAAGHEHGQASLVSPPTVENAQQLIERRGLRVCRFVKIAAGALRGSIGSAEFKLSLAPACGKLD
jgi:hypothetical protein